MLAVLPPALAEPAPLPPLAGLTLAQAIDVLHARGLEVTFSEALVKPELRVLAEPRSADPAAALVEILAPHGLELATGPGGRLVIVRRERREEATIRGVVRDSGEGSPLPGVRLRVAGRGGLEARTDSEGRFEIAGLAPGTYSLIAEVAGFAPVTLHEVPTSEAASEVEIQLSLALTSVDELVVTPSRITVSRQDPVVRLSLTTEELRRLPVAGDDPLRAAKSLPGTAGGDFSAQLNVRGGYADELLVMLDGLELFEPFHLPEYQNAFSIVAPETVGRLDLITGGFPASYGDRMSGVLDMTSVEPAGATGALLGLSVLDAQALGSGTFRRDAGSWIASGRLSLLPYAARVANQEEDPGFFDLFAKVGYELSPSHSLRGQWLLAQDTVRFEIEQEAATRQVDAKYRSVYGWVSHAATFGAALLETIASVGELERNRNGIQLEPLRSYEVHDPRDLEIAGIRQKGSWQLSPRHSFKWGWSVRRLIAEYDYFNSVRAAGAATEEEVTRFAGTFSGRQTGLFVTDRFRPFEDLTFELGARWDENHILDQSHTSPRVSLAWAVSRRNVVRLAWGHYYQSQRAYELQVGDGETEFSADERAEQRVAAFERVFDGGLDLRIEAYSRRIDRPRARFENLLDPVSSFPEVEADRVLIAPERSWARGVEVLARHRGRRFDVWSSYAWSEIDDRLDGRDVPRAVDQTHSLKGTVSARLGEAWELAAGWTFHTGWPTTALLGLDVEPDEGEVEPSFGPIRAERLSDYERLDLRATRRWSFGRGELTAYADLINALDATNTRGVELALAPAPEDDLEADLKRKRWLGRVLTAGVRWRF